jgi:hypothetical protein
MSALKTCVFLCGCLRLLFLLKLFSINMKNSFIILSILMFPFAIQAQKITLSPLETLQVKESNVFWKAELDSASDYTVINASSIAVMNASFPKEKNITKQISFKLKNGDGEGRTVNSKVTGVVDWNGQQLYTAELEIGVIVSNQWEYRKVNCVLADLTEKEHKLLIGKNWLGEDIEVR